MELLSKTYQAILVLSVFLKTFQQYLIELSQEQVSDQVELVPTSSRKVVVKKEQIIFSVFYYMVLWSQYIHMMF